MIRITAVKSTHRVEYEDGGEEVEDLVCTVTGERVEDGEPRRSEPPSPHVRPCALTRRPHVIGQRRAQRVDDQVQLLQRALSLCTHTTIHISSSSISYLC